MTDTTADARAKALLDQLNHALGDRDFAAASRLFADECYWRDLVLLTWNIKTMEGQGRIADMLAAQLDAAAPVRFSLDARETVEEADGVVSAWIVIDTRHARGGGHVRIRDGRIWTLLTAAQELKGHEESMGTRRPMGAEHGIRRGRQTWLERRQQEAEELGRDRQPFVLVIGGGQGGIALGARLRQLGVSHIVIDRQARPGDQWRNRYVTNTCRTCRFRTTGPCSRPRTRSVTGWRCTPR
jgi:putative flavoprotein involved in K+ transport